MSKITNQNRNSRKPNKPRSKIEEKQTTHKNRIEEKSRKLLPVESITLKNSCAQKGYTGMKQKNFVRINIRKIERKEHPIDLHFYYRIKKEIPKNRNQTAILSNFQKNKKMKELHKRGIESAREKRRDPVFYLSG